MPNVPKRPATTLANPRNLTSVNGTMAFVLGLALAAVIYFAAYLMRPSLVYDYLYNRGNVQYVSTAAFGWALMILFMKVGLIKSQTAAFDVVQKDVFDVLAKQSTITTMMAEQIRLRLEKLPESVRRSMLVNRLENSCRRLSNIKSAAEVDNIFQMLSEHDANLIESSYTVVKFLFALIPLLGFIGNVLGVGEGIGAFSKALGTAQSFTAIRPVLQFASLKLSSAFDTTFLALAYSGVILAFNAIVQQREENLLAAVDDYCLERFISRIQVESSDVSDLKTHMTSLVSDLVAQLDTNEKGVVRAIQDLGRKDFGAGLGTHIEALGIRVDVAAGKLEGKLETLSKKSDTVAARIEAVGGKIGSGGGSGGLDAIRRSVEALANSVEEQSAVLAAKLGELAKQQGAPNEGFAALAASMKAMVDKFSTLDRAADAFQLVSGMSGMFEDLKHMLAALKPAIDSMSDEMAKEINHVLSQLLRIMVVVHRVDRMTPEELRPLNDETLLRKIFIGGEANRRQE